jgi:hypothetical protein
MALNLTPLEASMEEDTACSPQVLGMKPCVSKLPESFFAGGR